MDVKDKFVVVTGGAKGIGRSIVRTLARAGARPIIHYYQSEASAQKLAAEVQGFAIQADLSQRVGPQHLVENVLRYTPSIALWVNNAADFVKTAFLESTPELWQRTLQLTLLSPVDCCRAIAPHLIDGGLIVNILDLAAYQAWKGYAHHCVAKAALLMFTRCLALELGPRLRVGGVVPGIIQDADDDHQEAWTALIARAPLGKAGVGEDIGQAVRFLMEADYVTGSVITVDGGLGVRALNVF